MNLCMKLLTFGKCRERFNLQTKPFLQRTVWYSKMILISKCGLTCILPNKMKVVPLLLTFRVCPATLPSMSTIKNTAVVSLSINYLHNY